MDEEILESTWEALRQETNMGDQRQRSPDDQDNGSKETRSLRATEEASKSTKSSSSSTKKLTPAQRKELRKNKLQERGENRFNEIRGLLGKSSPSVGEHTYEQHAHAEQCSSEHQHALHAAHVEKTSADSTQCNTGRVSEEVDTRDDSSQNQRYSSSHTVAHNTDESSKSPNPLQGHGGIQETSVASNMVDKVKAMWKAESMEHIFLMLKWILLLLGAVYCGCYLPQCALSSDSQWFWEHSRVLGDSIFAPRYLTIFRLQQAQHSMPEYLQDAHEAAVKRDQGFPSNNSKLCQLNEYLEESGWLPLSYPLLVIGLVELCKGISKQGFLLLSVGSFSWNIGSGSTFGLLSILQQWMWILLKGWYGIVSEVSVFVVCSIATASIVDAYAFW